MGKMMVFLMLCVAIELALYVFPANQAVSQNSLLNLVLHPNALLDSTGSFISQGGTSNQIIIGIQNLIIAFILIAGLSVGTGFVFKQDSVIFASIAAIFGLVTLRCLTDLWAFLYSYSNQLGTSTEVLIAIVMFPLLVFWIIVTVDFIRGRD